MTSMPAEACEAFSHMLASAGALTFLNAYAESAALPALSNAFAARRGKTSWGPWRLQCPTFLRQTCVEGAAESLRHSFWAQGDDQQQCDKGKAHQVAVRALAFKWLRILYRCWQERTPYDESVYLPALNRRSATLLHHLAH